MGAVISRSMTRLTGTGSELLAERASPGPDLSPINPSCHPRCALLGVLVQTLKNFRIKSIVRDVRESRFAEAKGFVL